MRDFAAHLREMEVRARAGVRGGIDLSGAWRSRPFGFGRRGRDLRGFGGGVAAPVSVGGWDLLLDERGLSVGTGYSAWADQSSGGTASWSQGTAANQPATGSTINGYPAPDFDGVNDRLTCAVNASVYATTTALEGFAIVQVDALGAGNDGTDGTPYVRPAFFSNQGGATLGLSVSASGVKFFVFDGAYKNTPFATIPTGSAQLVAFRFVSGVIYVRVGAGTEQSTSGVGTISTLAVVQNMGCNYNASSFYDGKIASLRIRKTPLTAAERAQERAFLAYKYGVAT